MSQHSTDHSAQIAAMRLHWSLSTTRHVHCDKILLCGLSLCIGLAARHRRWIQTAISSARALLLPEVTLAPSSRSQRHQIALFTAYTRDYPFGDLCARVSSAYAAKCGYSWKAFVQEDRDPNAERHPSWDKVRLMLEMLDGLLAGGTPHGLPAGTTHLVWIDADAVVLRHEKKLEDLIDALPLATELIIGEDLTLNVSHIRI